MTAKKGLQNRTANHPDERDQLDREYREHARWLLSVARRRLGSSAEAEDFVQEAYIRAARYPAGSRTKPRPLLARILKNLIRDRARAWKREQTGRRLLAVADVPPCSDAEQHSLLVLKQVILGMPDTYREVFLRSRFTTLSQAQIASKLGISLKTVEWRLSKALAYCAESLAE